MSLWNGLRELPSTNFRIFVSVLLEALFAAVTLFCMATNRFVNVELVWAIGLLITGWLGIGVAQFRTARMTDREYAAIKNAAPPASNVTVEAPAQVTVNQPAAPVAQVAPAAPPPSLASGERGA